MDLIKRFFGIISNPSHTRTIGILAVLTIALAIPLTVNIAQKQQELRQHAGFSGSCTTVGAQQKVPCSKTCSDGSTVQGVSVQECQSNLQWYDDGTCYASCPSTSTPATTPATPKPACTPTKAVSCNPACGTPTTCGRSTTCIDDCGNTYTSTCDACQAQIIPPATPAGITCPQPNGTIPSTPHSGNTEEWGGSCAGKTINQDIAVAIPNTCSSCTVARCEVYSGGPQCWVNNGQTYNDSVGCVGKGASFPASCPVPGPTVTPTPSAAPITGIPITCSGGDPICSPGTGLTAVKIQSNGYWACINPQTQAYSTVYNPYCSSTGSATLSISLNLQGLGYVGDVKNPGSQVFNTPRKTRIATAVLLDVNNNSEISRGSAPLSYNYGTGLFTATVSLPNVDVTKSYNLKVRANGYLWKNFGTISSGQSVTSVTLGLVTGDIDGDNSVTALDVSILMSCSIYSTDNGAACNSNPAYRALSDLNDDGTVDQIDYNLILREFGQTGN